MDHFADIPTHSAKRHKSCQILSPSQNTLSDTQQYVTNTAKFCPPLKTYSQTLSNTSSILSNSVPQTINTQSAVSRFRSDRALEWITLWTSPRTMQNGTNIAKFCPPLKTYSQTLTNTSPILLNSVPSQNTPSDTQQYVINPVKFCPQTICTQYAHNTLTI